MRRLQIIAIALTVACIGAAPAVADARSAGTSSPLSSTTRPGVAPAGDSPSEEFDSRRGLNTLVQPTKNQLDALSALFTASGSAADAPRVTWNHLTGTPRSLRVPGGYLSGPKPGTAAAVARGWLDDRRALFALTGAEVAALDVTRDHALPGTGARVITFAQTFGGVRAVHGGTLIVAVDKDGQVLSYAGDPVRGGGLLAGFTKSATDALTKVVGDLAPGVDYVAKATGDVQAGYTVFGAGPFGDVQRVMKIAFPTVDGARPAYSVLLVKSPSEAYDVVIDAATGEKLLQHSLVDHESGPEGTVYENFPGAAKGGTPVVKSFGPTAESPAGWVDPTGIAALPGPTTLGNNANTFAQYTAPLAPTDQLNRPVSPTSQFNYTYTDNWGRTKGTTLPPSYVLDRDPAVTNLFYQHNRIHDQYYKLGFTETAGNFQVSNNGKGGNGGDPVSGLVHSGALSGGSPTYLGRDNANMLTLPDGIPSFSSMYLWEPINDTFEGPYADGDFDATVIQHEYSHGLTNRYTGGGGLGSLGGQQSGSMGEGWGDWYAMDHLHREGMSDKAVVGAYATGNAERGIRNWDYDHNPLTYGDFGYDLTGPEVHADGEFWTATLWDLRKALVARYGEQGGSDAAEHLVTDALPLSPPSPSVLDMRDAILAADALRYHGDNTDTIWSVFARRGAGRSASTVDSDDTNPVPAFDHASPSRNGTLTGAVVNAATGKPIEGARVIVGEFEARVTPLARTSAQGGFTAPMTGGTYTLTMQAPGYGIQTFRDVDVTAGQTTARTFKLAPNLASSANGASVEATSSQDDALPAKFLLDDTENSSWKTKDTGTPYNSGGNQYTTVKLARQADISSIKISALKPTSLPRFNAAKDFTVQTSTDGVQWKTVKTGTFAAQAPRPVAPDLNIRTLRLDSPVNATYVRVYVDSVQGESKTYATLAELEVFAEDAAVEPLPSTPEEPFTVKGGVKAGNPAAGVLLLPGTEPYRPGVTTAEFTTTCNAEPTTQGADAWVAKLPSGFADGLHTVSYSSDAGLDFYFFDSSCKYLAGRQEFAQGPSVKAIPPGAAYVVLQAWYAADSPFTLTAQRAD
ncbi:M36 family metallopeptidase [Streptomyces sp. V3I7]|uniref:M36 family metallopeptidase n=1 Tax=Streptomyces sp. V3I7 TaxID=3042278 RepID=UPI00278A5484|nr:M36 family metallopeptidase [Streptomyces sp. V3I7]MDQ0994483.1 extracellular elastinolytic metalloproteinase [Streptomyces sp. V3I7]